VRFIAARSWFVVVKSSGIHMYPAYHFLTAEMGAKRLNLLRELVPAAAHVSMLVNPANATSTESTLKDVLTAARAIGLQTQVLNASTGRKINAAFATLMTEKSGCPLCCRRRIFQPPPRPTGASGDAPCGSRDLFATRV
jgi:hypothetical protein